MFSENLQIGKCYFCNKHGHKPLVRKILSIDLDVIHYEVLLGPDLHKHKFNKTKLKNFANWAQREIEEMSDYSHLFGSKIEKNYVILNTLGEGLFVCQEKKLKFYVKKNLVKQIDEDTFQLLTSEIEQKLYLVHDNKLPDYVMIPKNTCCVVCGGKKNMTKHHVIPKKDLKYYAKEFKRDLSNRLFICRECHDVYERKKEGVEFTEYNKESALKWMQHFIDTMKPKFLPNEWHIISVLKHIHL